MIRFMRDPNRPGNHPYCLSGLRELCGYLLFEDCCGAMYEIGSFAGESAAEFAKVFDVVNCVDPWGPSTWPQFKDGEIEESFNEVADLAGNIVKHKGTSLEVASRVADFSMDFVYLDGPHRIEEVDKQLAAWYSKVKQGAFIGGHDYDRWDVAYSVDTILGKNRVKLFPDQSWVVRKI